MSPLAQSAACYPRCPSGTPHSHASLDVCVFPYTTWELSVNGDLSRSARRWVGRLNLASSRVHQPRAHRLLSCRGRCSLKPSPTAKYAPVTFCFIGFEVYTPHRIDRKEDLACSQLSQSASRRLRAGQLSHARLQLVPSTLVVKNVRFPAPSLARSSGAARVPWPATEQSQWCSCTTHGCSPRMAGFCRVCFCRVNCSGVPC